MRVLATLLCGFLAAAGAAPAAARPTGRSGDAPPAAGSELCLPVRTIRIRTQNVFPEAAGNPLAPFYQRAANAIHATTRASVIARSLTFRRGDCITQEALDASARRLRRLGFLHPEVELRAVPVAGSLDVQVLTRDLWTMAPRLNFSRHGSLLRWSVAFEDDNLLGFGKWLAIGVGRDEDGSFFHAGYGDPLTPLGLGRLTLSFADGKAGSRLEASVRDDPWLRSPVSLEAVGFFLDGWMRDRRGGTDGPLHGIKRAQGRLDALFVVGGDGHSSFWVGLGGFGRYERPVGEGNPFGRAKILFGGPAFGLLVERSVVRRFVRALGAPEDWTLGPEVRVAAGAGPGWEDWGAGIKGVSGRFLWGAAPGGNGVVQVRCSGWFASRRDHERMGRLDSKAVSFLRLGRHTLGLGIRYAFAVGALVQDVVTLGAEEGLRGFQPYSFWGERALLVNAEDRISLLADVAGLIDVGAAVFADAGWLRGAGGWGRVRKCVGLGLRLAGRRARSSEAVRVDLACPVGEGGLGRPVLSIAGEQAF